MATSRMEVYGAYPILVSLTGHYVLLVFDVPDLPCAVITSCSNDLLLRMQRHASNSSWLRCSVSINLLIEGHPVHEVIECLREVRVWPCVLGPWRILAFHGDVLFSPASHSLLLHASVDLFLDLLFMFGNGFLNVIDSLLKLVFLELEKRLFFDSIEVLFLDFLDFLLVVLVQVSHFLDVLGDGDLLGVHAILMGLMEVSLLPDLLPG